MTTSEFKHLKSREEGDITVVEFPEHRLYSVAEVHGLGDDLKHLLCENRRKVVLDFAAVEFVPSEVLGKLIGINRKLSDQGCAMRLCNLAPGVLEILRISCMDRIFTIKQDLAEAMASF